MNVMTRRTAILGLSIATMSAQSEDRAMDQPDKLAGAAWMDKWMSPDGSGRQPEGGLYLGRFADPIYFLTQPITWKPNPGQEKYKEVNVPWVL